MSVLRSIRHAGHVKTIKNNPGHLEGANNTVTLKRQEANLVPLLYDQC